MTDNKETCVPVERPILDANIGMTNRIEEEDAREVIIRTLHDLGAVLSRHCGPYGEFAMIVNPGNSVAEPVFTKDGIGIVRAMEYMSPMQEFVRRTIAYMGSRIETAAGDGTTSAMLILTTGLRSLLDQLRCSPYIYQYRDLVREYDAFMKDILETIDYYSYSVKKTAWDVVEKERQPEATVLYNIAYSQAYTSSHGDRELADAVARIFSETPRIAWNYVTIDKCRMESSRRFTVETDDSQYSVQGVRIWPQSALTEDLGTSRVRNSEDVIISGVAPGTGYEDGQMLLNDILAAVKDRKPLTVICPAAMDTVSFNELKEVFRQNPDSDVCLIMIPDEDPRINDILCMKVLLNRLDVCTKCVLDYVYRDGELKILHGLYANTENAKINPNLEDPAYVPLRNMLDHLDKVIAQIKTEVSTRSLNQELKRLQTFRHKLTCTRRTCLKIGGTAYDNAAAVDVVLDAMLATKHTLTKGFVMGGGKTLWKILFLDGIYAVHQAALSPFLLGGSLPSEYFQQSVDIAEAFRDMKRSAVLSDDDLTSKGRPVSDIWTKPSDQYVENPGIIQPVDTDLEMVKRFGELALKLAKMCRIIAPGGVVMSLKKDHALDPKSPNRQGENGGNHE